MFLNKILNSLALYVFTPNKGINDDTKFFKDLQVILYENVGGMHIGLKGNSGVKRKKTMAIIIRGM